MRRREFISLLGGSAVAWPFTARAQQTGKVWRIGYLAGVSRSADSGSYAAFVQGMRELGYIEGKDFVIEWRSVEGRYERFPEVAAELVRLKVDIFVTGVTAALPALQRATTTIPIVRLLTRRGIDWTARYPSIAAAVAALSCRSCLIDGEVVICGDDGVPVFDKLRYGRQPQAEAVLFAFDLLELGGKDLPRTPLEERKQALAKLLRRASKALQLNEHITEPGDIVFRHACKLGFEGIVSKRLGSPYVSGRSRHWIKSKNPAAPAVKREAEEDWGKARWR